MAEVSFFHNERDDNGTRTGLNVGGRRALERFIPGDEESDPSLRWYVDVVISTKSLPKTQSSSAIWLTKHADAIQEALEAAAARLEVGLDFDSMPWTFKHRSAQGIIRVSVSALRCLAAREIAKRIRDFLATTWVDFASHPISVE